METQNHLSCTGQTPLTNASGLKLLPQSVEPVYTNSTLTSFSQHGKVLKYDMPVNGLISPSLSNNAHGTLLSNDHITHNSVSNNYDYLWKKPKSSVHKDSRVPSQFLINGSSCTITNGPSIKRSPQETLGNCTSNQTASCNLSSNNLCSPNEADIKVVTAANGTHYGFCEASLPDSVSASSMQSVSADNQVKEGTEQESEAGTSEKYNRTPELAEALEPSDAQTDLNNICEYKETDLDPVIQSAPNPLLPPDVSNLDDPSQLPSQLGKSHLLNEDSLEPFGTDLIQDPISSTMYDLEEMEVGGMQQKDPPLDASSLECPSYTLSASFPLMAEDTHNSSVLFNAASASPVLGDSVMQESASEMDEDPEGSKAEEPVSVPENVSQDEMNIENTSPEPCVAAETEEEELEPGEVKGTIARRRMATPEQVCFPLRHGWKREVRIRKGSHRWQGETWYYAPCGKRMKQFPEVIKYLSKNAGPYVRREHFSFSPRMPVGDFYEEQNTAEGPQWILLNSEEIPSRIIAITGKRGRPRNMEKAKAKEQKVKRGRGRPPKVKMIDLLSKPDAKLLRKLENQDILSDAEKLQLCKLKKKMRRKARNQEAKLEAAKKIKHCLFLKEMKEKEEKLQKIKEKAKNKEKKKVRRQPKEKAPVIHKPDRKQLAQQRRLEERKRQQFILEELKKPTEDMCLPDHQQLPDFPCVPGLVLPSCAFSDCLTTVEFLHSYGKVLGLDEAKDIPSLCTLQEGLFNVGDSLGEVQDLLVKLLRAAMINPGLPPYCQSLKILGEKVSEIGLNRENVSEPLRLFLESYGGDIELCDSLRSHPFQAHAPHVKAKILAFLVNELNASSLIISEIDKTLENMSHYRKHKWIIEGKIRRLKFALSKRKSSEESQTTTAEESQRRRSERNAEENDALDIDDSTIQKDFVEVEIPSSTSVVELERQIEKLTKRQMFFRKKILGSSQRLRTVCLGQDRYRRCYWMVPHLGGIFIEGLPESAEPDKEPTLDTGTEASSLKSEDVEKAQNKSFDSLSKTQDHPRKSRAEPEHNCTSCRHSASKEKESNVVEQNPNIVPLSHNQQDLSQSVFLSWLTKNQNIMDSTVLTPESSPPHSESTPIISSEAPEKPKQWLPLHSRTPCRNLTQGSFTRPSNQSSPPSPTAATSVKQAKGFKVEAQSYVTSLPSDSTPCHACANPGKSSTASHETTLNSQLLGDSEKEKRRGRPPSKLLKQIEQKYYNQLIERPIPVGMRQKWWWIKDPAMLELLLKALHPRGIREKTLHKHLSKHLQHLKEMCARPASDALFKFTSAEGHPVSQETLDKWSVTDLTFQVDLSALQWVEDLEQRVILSDLQQRGWTPPAPDSVRTDLKYYEHLVEPADDITVKVKREDCRLYRVCSNPLDLAVLRLLCLEENLEKRYLKEPLWLLSEVQHEKAVITNPEDPLSTTEIEYSITSRLRLWRQTVERCRSAAQLSLCLQQLERSIAWERSVNKVTCLYCRKGDNDEFLLLCDSCDRGCHTYCHKPQMNEIPEGDWFCPTCISLQCESEFLRTSGSSRRIRKCTLRFKENSPAKPSRRREHPTTSQYSPGESPVSKRRRMATRSHSPDLTFCEIILMELESHEDAWPFLEPVNPRLVPGYRKIIKNPMDFSTIRHKLLNGKYSSCEEFAEDAELVFSNCQLFNEDDSEVGKAGLILKKFYDARWEEFSQERNQISL
uniref:Bromodomain adjacent to zinc finger domain 2A n=2 Tax=Xenopus tropicalis TaxID=8364 RepID=F6T5B1_XENTR